MIELPEPPPLPQRLGRYEVLECLGEGSMGMVVRAMDPQLLRPVAVKLLHPELRLRTGDTGALLERIRREALVAASLSHPHIVTLFDVGEDEEHGLYLVFELLKGPSLQSRLQAGPLPRGEAAVLVRQIGSALTFAHRAGLVHRDVKPSNISVEPHGAKLADFGIVRLPNSSLTGNHRSLGTPAYAAPESVSRGDFSPRSDQFSLAATLWEALSGRRLFPGEDAMAVSHAVLSSPIPKLPAKLGLPTTANVVFARALERDPERRFDTCAAFAEALADVLHGEDYRDPAPTVPALRRTHELGQARRAAHLSGFVLGVASVAALWFGVARWKPSVDKAPPVGYLAPSPSLSASPAATP